MIVACVITMLAAMASESRASGAQWTSAGLQGCHLGAVLQYPGRRVIEEHFARRQGANAAAAVLGTSDYGQPPRAWLDVWGAF
jgi:hypothetical protein